MLIEEDNSGLLSEQLAILRKRPGHGPRVLFFSGGTALNPLSRYLKSITTNSIHIITPFDSGGSSAALRKAFAIPAMGDVRNRLLALADDRDADIRKMARLLGMRFSTRPSQDVLITELAGLAQGNIGRLDIGIEAVMPIVADTLARFLEYMPAGFDLRGASIGNLVLAARYLDSDRDIAATIAWFSELINAQGKVAVAANADMHLASRLADGTIMLGQDRITGKESAPIPHAIEDIWLTPTLDNQEAADVPCDPTAARLISQADLICYPPGSFFSSLIANLLPSGIREAVAANRCPKVFIPNLGIDPECPGWRSADALRFLTRCLCEGKPNRYRVPQVLTHVLTDQADRAAYSGRDLEESGIHLRIRDLVSTDDMSFYDPARLSEAIVSLTLNKG